MGRIERWLFEAATNNDGVVARRLARDAALVGRAGARFARGDLVTTDRFVCVVDPHFRLVFEEPLLVRLDQVVSAVTGLGRDRVRAMGRCGQLSLMPHGSLTRLRLAVDTLVVIPDR